MKRVTVSTMLTALAALWTIVVWADAPPLINFQGILRDGSGNPVANGTYSVTFKIYNVPVAGAALFTETQSVTTTSGLFTALIGSATVGGVPSTVFNDTARYLGLAVAPDPEMTPRQQLVSVTYGYRVQTVDSALGGTIKGNLKVTGTGTFGPGHTNTGGFNFVAGSNNNASAGQATISGGDGNTVTGTSGTVSGGNSNTASGSVSTVGGGTGNEASAERATVGGGYVNLANAIQATVGGGGNDTASGSSSTVAGGNSNAATGNGSTVGGGGRNKARGLFSTVAGGGGNSVLDSNSARGDHSAIGGGQRNLAEDTAATVGGGKNNKARGKFSVIAGGGSSAPADSNSASGDWAVIGGGNENIASGLSATIAGGNRNIASNTNATVGGGALDSATGFSSTVPGGFNNKASGNYSFAGGLQAKAIHTGAFVWADASSFTDFASTAVGQFLIRAAGGVGIGSDNPLDHALHVTDDFNTAYTEMVELQSTTVPSAADDILAIESPLTATVFQFIECTNGGDIEFRVDSDGDAFVDGTFNGGGADFAEMIAVSSGGAAIQPGDVLVIDPNNPRSTVKSSQARSTLVAGIYSTKPGFVGSERDWDKPAAANRASQEGTSEEVKTYSMEDMAKEFNEIPLAVVGIVPCKVSAENGPIRPGDLLVTSSTAGHAMRDDNPKVGTVLGKALGVLSSGTGVIKVLVTLH